MFNTKHDNEEIARFLQGAATDLNEGKPVHVVNCHGHRSMFRSAITGFVIACAAMSVQPAHAGILGDLAHPETTGAKLMSHIYEANGAVGSMQGASEALRYANGNPASIASGVVEGIGGIVRGGAAVLGLFGHQHKTNRDTYQGHSQRVNPQVESQPGAAPHENDAVREVDGPWHDVAPK